MLHPRLAFFLVTVPVRQWAPGSAPPEIFRVLLGIIDLLCLLHITLVLAA